MPFDIEHAQFADRVHISSHRLLFQVLVHTPVTNRPIARGGAKHNPKSAKKGQLLTTKWAKNGVFVGRLRG